MCVSETFKATHTNGRLEADPPKRSAPEDIDGALGERRPSRRAFFKSGAAVGAGVALASVLPRSARAASPTAAGYQDLTHVLRDGAPVYPGLLNPRRVTLSTVDTGGFYIQQWTFPEHVGTHVDMPGHFHKGGRLVTDYSLSELVMPAVVVDISGRAQSDPDTAVTVDDLRATEEAVGRLPDRGAVLMYSGWDTRIADEGTMRNFGPDGRMHTPGWSPEAIDWLLSNRNVSCIGTDTLSLDTGVTTFDFPVHKAWLPADKLGIEVLANLGKVPRAGWTLVVGVVPLEQGSGGPGRIFAIIGAS